MDYNVIQPPIGPVPAKMPRADLCRYFQWFMEALPQRVDELTVEVNRAPGFEIWIPDRKPNSLNLLGEWFAGQIGQRKRTLEEIRAIKETLSFPIEISDKQLTIRTLSLAMDVGMYFSQVLLKNCPTLKWEQPLNDKRFADYGQPVLAGFPHRESVNPVRIVHVIAQGLSKGSRTGARLREVYDIWAAKVKANGLILKK